jgi:photosystem II stability/assembly factor-like uncharacterized protein
MKKILTVILITGTFYCTNIFAQTGWYSQTSGTANNLNCVYFINNNQGYVVGDSGALLMTTDGGSNWGGGSLGGSLNFYSVYFWDAANGIILGSNQIWRTTDGGMTWMPPINVVSDNLYTMSFYGVNGIIGGDSQDILYTSDEGFNWAVAQSGFFGGGFYGSYMLNSSIGFVAGENSIFQPLFGVSTNSGANWNFVSFYLNGNEGSLSGVYFSDQNNGVTSAQVFDGTGAVSVTTDGGNNWSTTIFPYALNDINFPTATTGYSVGDNGEILKSTTSGNSWESQSSGTSSNLLSVYFPSENTGYTVGEGGIILKTTTGGVTPVELTNFSAALKEDEVTLKWQTATETNNRGFEIDRLKDSRIERLKNWEKIGFVQGFGTTAEKHDYSFSDKNISSGEYNYRLKQIDFDGSCHYSNVVSIFYNQLPTGYALEQNYPNPFNPATTIKYSLPFDSNVKIVVYNSLGSEVKVLTKGSQLAGNHEVIFDASGLASGVYFYSLTAQPDNGQKSFKQIKKALLLK